MCDTKKTYILLFSQIISKLEEDITAKDNIIKSETVTKVEMLKTELNQSKLSFETKIKILENEKEKEINRVYIRYEFFNEIIIDETEFIH